VKALLEFRGQGRINEVYKTGRSPKSAEDKVLQMPKDTLEGEGVEEAEGKHKRTLRSKKAQEGY
jgi:hypothetical protein